MFWLAVALGTIVVAGGLFGAYHWLRSLFNDLDFGGALTDIDKIWTPEPFPNTGRLPMSSRVAGTFLRWHKQGFYFVGDGFWKTFQDGPWKWEDQQRYAGKDDNCGHYFALTESGARAEGSFYRMDFSAYRLLAADFEFDAVLDLTYESNLVELAKQTFSNWQDISERHFLVTILSYLVDPEKGGTQFTDYIGHWASRHGYDGILFFGARAIGGVSGLRDYIDGGADEGMAGPVVHGYFHDMRQNDDLKNLVIFSGARMTAKVKTSRLLPDPAVANPYYGASDADIDAKLVYRADEQEERLGNIVYLATPFTIT